MRIADAFGPGKPPVISFEFPPKTPEAEARLFETVAQLAPLRPTFVSVTYGAGGTTRRLTRLHLRRLSSDPGGERQAGARLTRRSSLVRYQQHVLPPFLPSCTHVAVLEIPLYVELRPGKRGHWGVPNGTGAERIKGWVVEVLRLP